jgi:hypothetical protein
MPGQSRELRNKRRTLRALKEAEHEEIRKQIKIKEDQYKLEQDLLKIKEDQHKLEQDILKREELIKQKNIQIHKIKCQQIKINREDMLLKQFTENPDLILSASQKESNTKWYLKAKIIDLIIYFASGKNINLKITEETLLMNLVPRISFECGIKLSYNDNSIKFLYNTSTQSMVTEYKHMFMNIPSIFEEKEESYQLTAILLKPY